MSKFTPGPWHIQELPLGNEGEQEPTFRITGESTLHLEVSPCSDGFQFGQNEANARLIAAAPDLLSVCRSLDEFQRRFDEATFGCGMPGNDLYAGQLMMIVAAARDAIAKAMKGQS